MKNVSVIALLLVSANVVAQQAEVTAPVVDSNLEKPVKTEMLIHYGSIALGTLANAVVSIYLDQACAKTLNEDGVLSIANRPECKEKINLLINSTQNSKAMEVSHAELLEYKEENNI